MPDISERVHIAPMGVEDDRITESALEYKAERVILMEYIPPTSEMTNIKEEITKRFDENGVEYEFRTVGGFEDLFEGTAEFIRIIEEHCTDELWVNISSGNKISAVAGMIACATTEVATPYYVTAEGGDSNDPMHTHSEPAIGVQEVQEVPPYPMDRPSDDELLLMNLIDKADISLRDTERPFLIKKGLIENGRSAGVEFLFAEDEGIDSRGKTETHEYDIGRADHNRLRRNFIDPFTRKGFIEVHDERQSDRVMLTQRGQNLLTAFRPLIE